MQLFDWKKKRTSKRSRLNQISAQPQTKDSNNGMPTQGNQEELALVMPDQYLFCFRKVLLIDSDADSRQTTKSVLEALYVADEVMDFTDVEPALSYIQEYCLDVEAINEPEPDWILLDYHGSTRDTTTFLNKLQELNQVYLNCASVTLLLHPATDPAVGLALMESYQMKSFLYKPITSWAIVSFIKEHC